MKGNWGRAAATFLIVSLAALSATAQESAAPSLLTQTTGTVNDLAGSVFDLLGPTPPPAPPSPAEVEQAFLVLTNRERAARGLRPLSMRADLVAVARRQSAAMAAKGELWHNTNMVNQLTGWLALGENVGRGPTVSEIHVAFMNSPSHRVNILDAGFTLVGMGAVVLEDGYIFITEDFEEPRTTSYAPRPASAQRAAAPSPAPARREPVAPAPVARTQVVDVLLRLLALDATPARPARGER